MLVLMMDTDGTFGRVCGRMSVVELLPDGSLTIELELTPSAFQPGRSRPETFHFRNCRLPLASVKALSGPVTAGRQAVMSMKQF